MGVSLKVVRAYLKTALPKYTFDEGLLNEFYERNEELFRLGNSLEMNKPTKVPGRTLRISNKLQEYFNCWWPIVVVVLKEKTDVELTTITKETTREEIGWTYNEGGGMRKFKGVSLFRHSGELYTEGYHKMEGVVILFRYDKNYYIKSPDGKEMRVWKEE